mmetsp:Transcript_31919/g.74712  ORF Transcript_31919/g.74712 Transcript_31919/m.74712 type:complete len:230 (-) Transcript_31919:175-864(-)|eukprot:CAMPEP_0178413866 /NCGR_PEP_ID=MMETSP0689_2-20121128/22746_1 /TAXON_ID=160604 /ORGANISM="Amphidinium massartii, Strain CS-259" /LENGTH=229 /DNA_ID=CAMNT_0020035147 /DNA_START=82 /DNA_END=771 /DNA_ORIENTATION=-
MADQVTAPMINMDLGPMPEDDVTMGVLNSFKELREHKEFCDVVLTVGSEQFFAHRAVLAAVSPQLCTVLQQPEHAGADPAMLNMECIRHPEALRAVLDHIYRSSPGQCAAYQPSNEEVNSDILRLAQLFQLPELQHDAALWLAKGLSTRNVLQRLRACEEFQLSEAREKIMEQLTANPEALYLLISDPEVTKVPIVIQELFLRALRLLGADKAAQGKHAAAKNSRKAGA